MAGARSPPTVALAFFRADRRSLPRCRRYEASGFGIIGSRLAPRAWLWRFRHDRGGWVGSGQGLAALRSLTDCKSIAGRHNRHFDRGRDCRYCRRHLIIWSSPQMGIQGLQTSNESVGIRSYLPESPQGSNYSVSLPRKLLDGYQKGASKRNRQFRDHQLP